MTEEEDNIFGDLLADTPVEVTQPSEPSRMAWEAWTLWAKITFRNDGSSPDRKFVNTYRDLLTRYGNEQLMECVRAAAHLPPHARDAKDIRRLINTLTRHGTEAYAIKLMNEGRETYHYGWRPAPSEFKSSVSDIEQACGINYVYWTERDQEAAGMMVEELFPERIEELAASARITLRQENVLPVDMLRFIHTKGVKGKADPGRGTYRSGRKEQETLEGLLLEADKSAERLVMKGVSISQVRQFHLQAPDGYWAAVSEMMNRDPSRSYQDIYQELKSEWSWDPDNREKP